MGQGPCFVSRQRLPALFSDLGRWWAQLWCSSYYGQQPGNSLPSSHCSHCQVIACALLPHPNTVEALTAAVGLIFCPELFALPAQCTSGLPQLPVLWWQQQQLLLCLCTDRKRTLEPQVSFLSHLPISFWDSRSSLVSFSAFSHKSTHVKTFISILKLPSCLLKLPLVPLKKVHFQGLQLHIHELKLLVFGMGDTGSVFSAVWTLQNSPDCGVSWSSDAAVDGAALSLLAKWVFLGINFLNVCV